MTEEWRPIWEEVVANRKRLDGCSRHQFIQDESGKFGSKFTCANCGGQVDAGEIWAYEQGYKHGQGAAQPYPKLTLLPKGIIQCPVGGELHHHEDGEVECYEGTRMWGFQLPPTVRFCLVGEVESADADMELRRRLQTQNSLKPSASP